MFLIGSLLVNGICVCRSNLEIFEWLPVKVDVPVPVVHRVPHLLNVTVEVAHPPAKSLASRPEETSTWRRGWRVSPNSRLEDLQNVR